MERDYRGEFVAQIVLPLAGGRAPWQQPLDGAHLALPFNPASGIVFRGGNAIALMMPGHADPRWCTAEEAMRLGWRIRDGELPTTVEFWQYDALQESTDSTTGEVSKVRQPLDKPIPVYAALFNACQMDGVPGFVLDAESRRRDGVAAAQRIIAQAPARIIYGDYDRASYVYSRDEIHLPKYERNEELAADCSDALHMLARASGHPKRLNRRGLVLQDFNETAREELRTALASLFLAQRLGLPYEPRVGDPYPDAWIAMLKADKNELFAAARDAEQIASYLMSFSHDKAHERDQEIDSRDPTSLSEAQRLFLRQQRGGEEVQFSASHDWASVVKPLLVKGLIVPNMEGGGYRFTGAGLRQMALAKSAEHLPKMNQALAKVSESIKKFPTSEIVPADKSVPKTADGVIYLNVPKNEYGEVKRIGGARWNKERESWFLPKGTDTQAFKKWLDMPMAMSQADIVAEFADALRDAGLVLSGMPDMDGKFHYTTVSTSRDEKALKGSYMGNLGDLPSGYIRNFDTGTSRGWTPKGLVLSDADRLKFQQQMEENKRTRDAEMAAGYAKIAASCERRWSRMAAAVEHPYLARKGVEAFGLRIEGDKLVTPARDIHGKVWSLQYIPAAQDQTKLFVKGGQKTGHFHVLGDLDGASDVLFAEGYATCASLHMAMRLPVVEVFDSGNMDAVMRALAPKLTNVRKLICGDDDVLTSEKILSSLNGLLASKLAEEKLGLVAARIEEALIDGQAYPLPGNPDCKMRLAFKDSPEGVPRVVGEIINEQTCQRLPILINNVGREKALAAATAHGAATVFPVFQSLEGGPTDFNDLHGREGKHVVAAQVAAALTAEKEKATVRSPGGIARQALGEGAVVESPKPDKRYVGTVLGNTERHAVQEVGRQTAVAHELEKLNRVPVVGKAVRIVYEGERGTVTDKTTRKRNEQER